MITKIECLEDYRKADKEWRDIVEFNTKEYFTSEEQERLDFLNSIMYAWAYHHVQEIWPTKKENV